MALSDLNKNAISFKTLSGKAHTQETFGVSNESIGSNVSMSYETVFGQEINSTPPTALYGTDGVVERVRFELEIIPDTKFEGRSQAYALKLPSNYQASTSSNIAFANGSLVHESLGKLQLVPPLFGGDYEASLSGTTNIAISKFDPIDWILNYQNGVVFIGNPPEDSDPTRPAFIDAYLYVGAFLNDVVVSGASSGSFVETTLFQTYTGSTDTRISNAETGITNLDNTKIDITEKGAANGVTPLDSNSLVPLIYLPSQRTVYIVDDVQSGTSAGSSREERFVVSGGTPLFGQVESYEGLLVTVLDSSDDPDNVSFTGNTTYVDSTGSLDWVPMDDTLVSSLDFSNITNKPSLIGSVTGGDAIQILNIVNSSGTTDSSIAVKHDDNTIKVVGDFLEVGDGSIGLSKLKLGGGAPITGQSLIYIGGDTFDFVDFSANGVDSLLARNGVINVGSSDDPIIEISLSQEPNPLFVSGGTGLGVKQDGIKDIHIDWGSGFQQVDANDIPIASGSTVTGNTVGEVIDSVDARVTANTIGVSDNSDNITIINSDISNLETDVASTITGVTNNGTGEGEIFKEKIGKEIYLKKIQAGSGVTIVDTGDEIIINASGGTGSGDGTIGNARDGSYDDGLFPFEITTPVGFAIDDINEILLALAPPNPPQLDNLDTNSTFASGKLSWGSTKNNNGFINVGSSPVLNSVVDIKGVFSASGTRKGIVNTPVTGILNNDILGNQDGANIPYPSGAFGDGEQGQLELYINGSVSPLEIINLSGSTAAYEGTYITVSESKAVKFANGNDFIGFKYRTGSFIIPVIEMRTGWNYARIVHNKVADSTTNFIEWVYDDNDTLITGTGNSLAAPTLSGQRFISGVEYHTSGTVDYTVTINDAYKNVYSNSSSAIGFNGSNLGSLSTMSITGVGIVDRPSTSLLSLPDLDTGSAIESIEDASFDIAATLNISPTGSKLIGNQDVSVGVSIAHPLKPDFSGAVRTVSDFLLYNVTESSNLNFIENFEGETYRLEDTDLATPSYSAVNFITYDWDSTQSLVGANAEHNTGLLVIDGKLVYPNSTLLNSYGITIGDFNSVAHGVATVNYSAASGERNYIRKFKSIDTSDVANMTLKLGFSGEVSDIITTGAAGGTPSINSSNVKVEFLVKRSSDDWGWFNPFSTDGASQLGVSIQGNASKAGDIITVNFTLGETVRYSQDSLFLVRIRTNSGWTEEITSIEIINR